MCDNSFGCGEEARAFERAVLAFKTSRKLKIEKLETILEKIREAFKAGQLAKKTGNTSLLFMYKVRVETLTQVYNEEMFKLTGDPKKRLDPGLYL